MSCYRESARPPLAPAPPDPWWRRLGRGWTAGLEAFSPPVLLTTAVLIVGWFVAVVGASVAVVGAPGVPLGLLVACMLPATVAAVVEAWKRGKR